MTFLLLGIVGGVLLGFELGLRFQRRREADIRVDAVEEAFERGRSVGGDALADEYLRAAADRPDPFDAWPAVRAEGRPS